VGARFLASGASIVPRTLSITAPTLDEAAIKSSSVTRDSGFFLIDMYYFLLNAKYRLFRQLCVF
jgi:hypothetical protein